MGSFYKPIFLLTLIWLIISSFSNEKQVVNTNPSQKNNILLIKYEESTDCMVIKEYKKSKNKYSKFCGDFIEIVEDFSSYNDHNKEFYVDGILKVSSQSNIIFWEYGHIREIILPFQYSYISIDSLINDSIVQFKLNNKIKRLKPGQISVDSIVSFVTEKNRLLKITTKFQLQNYGLILKNNVIDNEELLLRKKEELMNRDSIEMEELNKLDHKNN
jgi:hypothetical protein